jgi:hypothetical protein
MKIQRFCKGFAVLLGAVVLSGAALAQDRAPSSTRFPGGFGQIPGRWPITASGQSSPFGVNPHIDIVFAIDCSGSMGPVIETAKQKVWTIVNEVAKAKPSPVLRIGLIGYGNGDRSYRKFDLTDDLDEVYKNLMTFKDEGWSEEYVGRVIQKSLDEMRWSNTRKSLQIVYVVGNETARQGPIDYQWSAPQGPKKRVIINAVYCGSSGGQETWQEFSRLAEGRYLHIAGNGGAINISTPYDEELEKLNASINNTYIAYGARGSYGLANQAAQDRNSFASGGRANMASRGGVKASPQYNNRSWDLVDANRDPDFNIDKVRDEDLPAAMRMMTPLQRKAYLAQKTGEREQVRNKIKELAAKRAFYIEQEMKKGGLNADNSFDEAVRRSLREQGAQQGFSFGG